MKNKLTDLNDHLFLALERINDEELSNEVLDKEIRRAKGIVGISQAIIANASVQLEAYKVACENGSLDKPLPTNLCINKTNL